MQSSRFGHNGVREPVRLFPGKARAPLHAEPAPFLARAATWVRRAEHVRVQRFRKRGPWAAFAPEGQICAACRAGRAFRVPLHRPIREPLGIRISQTLPLMRPLSGLRGGTSQSGRQIDRRREPATSNRGRRRPRVGDGAGARGIWRRMRRPPCLASSAGGLQRRETWKERGETRQLPKKHDEEGVLELRRRRGCRRANDVELIGARAMFTLPPCSRPM